MRDDDPGIGAVDQGFQEPAAAKGTVLNMKARIEVFPNMPYMPGSQCPGQPPPNQDGTIVGMNNINMPIPKILPHMPDAGAFHTMETNDAEVARVTQPLHQGVLLREEMKLDKRIDKAFHPPVSKDFAGNSVTHEQDNRLDGIPGGLDHGE